MTDYKRDSRVILAAGAGDQIENTSRARKNRLRGLILPIQCLITGFSAHILQLSSEKSRSRVRRYSWAVTIISILWALIAFAATARYFKWPWWASLLASVVAVTIVVSLEKLIIHIKRTVWASVFRFGIALVMALIGSILIDQILFADDIDLAKADLLSQRVNDLLPKKTAEIREALDGVKADIAALQSQWEAVVDEIQKKPTIKLGSRSVTRSAGPRSKVTGVTVSSDEIVNPKLDTERSLREQIAQRQQQLAEKENQLLNVKSDVESELKGKVGFFDDLEIMKSIVLKNWTTMLAWGVFFALLLFLEMLVVLIKHFDQPTDYESRLDYEDRIRQERLRQMASEIGVTAPLTTPVGVPIRPEFYSNH